MGVVASHPLDPEAPSSICGVKRSPGFAMCNSDLVGLEGLEVLHACAFVELLVLVEQLHVLSHHQIEDEPWRCCELSVLIYSSCIVQVP